jgi:hypothetical protein
MTWLLGLQEVEGAEISRQSTHGDKKVVSPTHRPPLVTVKAAGAYVYVYKVNEISI